MILEFIIFLVGFIIGSIIIWFVRQKEFDSFKKSQQELKKNFSDLSNEVLLNSQKSFFEIAERKFSSLLSNFSRIYSREMAADFAFGVYPPPPKTRAETLLSYGALSSSTFWLALLVSSLCWTRCYFNSLLFKNIDLVKSPISSFVSTYLSSLF